MESARCEPDQGRIRDKLGPLLPGEQDGRGSCEALRVSFGLPLGVCLPIYITSHAYYYFRVRVPLGLS